LGSVPGSLIDWAAGVIGISPAIVRAQINEESGGNPNAVSPAGAQGPAQFMPGTWRSEGCAGSPFNVNDAMKCYAKYMYSLVKQEHGNVRDALAAYNAGPGNLQAGYGYADTILAAAGQPSNTTASGGTGTANATLTSATSAPDPTCAASWPTFSASIIKLPGIPNPSIGGGCIIHKATLRHITGGLIMVAGGLVVLPGVLVLAAFAFRRSGAPQAAANAVGRVYGQRAGQRLAGASPSAAPAVSGDRKIRTGRGQVSEDFASRYGTAPE